jgi:Tfp pilus assembly protein PilN
MRRSTLDGYLEKFAEAGVALACFTFSAGALHGAARLYSTPPAEGFLALTETGEGEIEAYGESPSHPVFSAQFDLPKDRVAALAAAELRLPQESKPLRFDQVLPSPVSAPADFDFSRSTIGYAAALSGACPRLAPAANLLPEEQRSSNSRMLFVPSLALAALLLLMAGAVFGYSRIEERHYITKLEAASARLEPQVRKIAMLDKSLQLARARAQLLEEFRGRSKSDLDALNELTRLLAPPIWANSIELTRDSVSLSGEADQAAPLLRLIDSSPFFRDSAFVIPIVKTTSTEMFRIHTMRRPR